METAFDTLAYAERLVRSGVDRKQATAHAEALRIALNEGVATKADIRDLKSSIRELKVKVDVIMWTGGIFAIITITLMGMLLRIVSA